jgi:hypothetical protein
MAACMNCQDVFTVNELICIIREKPEEYLHLQEDLKCHKGISTAALVACAGLEDTSLQHQIVYSVLECKNHPYVFDASDVRMCHRVLKEGKPIFVNWFMQRIGPYFFEYVRSLQNEQHHRHQDWRDLSDLFLRPRVFHDLPLVYRVEVTIMELAIDNFIKQQDLEMMLQETPTETFLENPNILVRLLRRCRAFCHDPSFWHLVPTEVWQTRRYVQHLVLYLPEIPRAVFPDKLRSDRDFFLWIFCEESFYRRINRILESNIRILMDDSLKGDKMFVLEAVRHTPLLLLHCAEELRGDPDIFLEGAHNAPDPGLFWDEFVDHLGADRLAPFLKAIRIRCKGLAFQSFLECCWKSCREKSYHGHALRLLDCGTETSTAIKKLIRSYGQETEESMYRIQMILERFAFALQE